MSNRTSYDKIYRPDVRTRRIYPTDAFLHADRFLPSAPKAKNASAPTWRGHANASAPTSSFPPPCPPHVRMDELHPRRRGTNTLTCPRRPERIRAHATRTLEKKTFKKKILIKIIFGSCCQLEKRKKKCSVFGFQSPISTRSARSVGFVGKAARRKRFFRPSSPSHPSKLYSSLGWLNSKVPKPFFSFTLRLIDVDGF
jgi:hypothetical protein